MRHQGFKLENAVVSKEQTMKLALGVIAAAILAVATVAWAQKPDFSGTWTLDAASAPAAVGWVAAAVAAEVEAGLWGTARRQSSRRPMR
jgi:hypothetical protein